MFKKNHGKFSPCYFQHWDKTKLRFSRFLCGTHCTHVCVSVCVLLRRVWHPVGSNCARLWKIACPDMCGVGWGVLAAFFFFFLLLPRCARVPCFDTGFPIKFILFFSAIPHFIRIWRLFFHKVSLSTYFFLFHSLAVSASTCIPFVTC